MFKEIDFGKVGRRIRYARKECNMTQEDLAAACGCTRNHLSAVETGENRPSLELIIRIASILNSSVDYFLMDSPRANPRYIIDAQIAPKLAKCSASDLALINAVIEEILKYRDAILSDQT